jgi:hypothetical protein
MIGIWLNEEHHWAVKKGKAPKLLFWGFAFFNCLPANLFF